jgi:hypothetical protein
VLFGFVLGNLNNVNLRIILTILSVLGIALTVAVLGFAFQLNFIKKQKYDRCKAIETLLGMRQHMELKMPKGLQMIVYCILTMLFISAWVIVLLILAGRI